LTIDTFGFIPGLAVSLPVTTRQLVLVESCSDSSSQLPPTWSSILPILRKGRDRVCSAGFWPPESANLLPAVNWQDAKGRVIRSYREWLRAVSADLSCLILSFRTADIILLVQVSRNPIHVLPKYARFCNPNKGPTRI